SSARGLTDVPRNVPDSILRRLPQNGGVVMVTFVPSFISQKVAGHATRRSAQAAELRSRHGSDTGALAQALAAWDRAHPAPKATLSDVADHIEHVRKLASVDNVGIGSDFDGIDDTPEGLPDVASFPALFAELSRRGWSETDLRKLAGDNLLRGLTRAEEVAQRLQRERPPSSKTIRQLDGPSGT
ncbi:MAG: dipeptidase, partial [Gemmatimonadaceae bacterium]